MKKVPIILVDMDGVLADFDRHFMVVWSARYPDRPALDQSRRTSFYIKDEFKSEYRQDIQSIFEEPGFYLDLPPVSGAVAAMQAMKRTGYDVWICSSPKMNYRYCAPEKYQWVERELGTEWVERVILTRRKAMIQGDVLIDDQPDIPFSETASWKQALFDAPYNRNHSSLPRINWLNWKTVLCDVLACVP
ncbi:MAG: 5'-3'-deoxyribonucleotidase [Deltaproteobacteria bacterium]|nr:5'-3'-deoxyribonucleotidase [Deltaproteobacteria bacterium]